MLDAAFNRLIRLSGSVYQHSNSESDANGYNHD